jgi:hypothetical protein
MQCEDQNKFVRDLNNPKSASYLNSLIELNNTRRLKSKLYDKCDDFTFPVINFQRMEFTFHNSYIILSHFRWLKHFIVKHS